MGRLIHHDFSITKENACLLFCDGRGIDLCAGFAICEESEDANAASEWRFSIALADLNIGSAETAITILALPSVQVAQDELLPAFQDEILAIKLTISEEKERLKEFNRVFSGVNVEVDPTKDPNVEI